MPDGAIFPSRSRGAPIREYIDRHLAQVGHFLSRHQRAIQTCQWLIVGLYLLLVAVPAFLPLPPRTAHMWNNLTVAAQFAFWGIWWPFVLLSMILVGRAWCGFLCPEGALTEAVSHRSRGWAIPRWLSWKGWPFAAFVGTTVYGQMTSVYQYPRPVLVVLGGSTLAAIIVGLFYGRGKRVWCRYLCPVNGVFNVLAKLAPVAFQVDEAAWTRSQNAVGRKLQPVNCAPLVPIRTMKGAGACHMCGRCSGFRDAVQLQLRAPNHEIVHVAGQETNGWETVLILFGMLGIAMGAFQWTGSPLFNGARQMLGDWLVNHDILWLVSVPVPWWILTDYPALNDVMTPLDGILLLLYIAGTALVFGGAYAALLAAGTAVLGRWSWARFHHLAQALIPMAGATVFLGLSATTVTLLKNDGLMIPHIDVLRGAILGGAALWSAWLGWRIAGLGTHGWRRLGGALCVALAALCAAYGVSLMFWGW